ncbi:MAG TPA: PEP-CTERM sorting domain-containing protein [Gemmatimonas sp.]|nr:PEP-CTERM sorting domain-containing protein [Gemmatimonas sp.]
MPRTLSCTARAAVALALCSTGPVLVASTAHAQATTVTFNSLTESSPGAGTRFITNCYSEGGFVFTAVGVPCTGAVSLNAFVAGSANSPIFGGGSSPSLLLNTPASSIVEVTQGNGGRFTMSSISLAHYFEAKSTTVMFTGMGLAGPVTQTFTLLGTQSGFQTFTFDGSFSNLSSIRMTAMNDFGEPLVKFDNFSAIAGTAVIPEPTTVALSALGLLGVAVLARRRTRA